MAREVIIVALGNRHAAVSTVQSVDEKTGAETRKQEALPKGKRATIVHGYVDEGATTGGIFIDITHPGAGVWFFHTAGDSGSEPPAWVASNRPALADLLAEHYGGIEVRKLEPGNLEVERLLAPAASTKEPTK